MTGGGPGPRLAVGTTTAIALAAELTEGDPDEPRTMLAVLDIPALIEGRGCGGPGAAALPASGSAQS